MRFMTLTYRCTHTEFFKGLVVKRPLIPVTLSGKKEKMNFTAILDSGSDFILLPREVADILELEYDESEREEGNTYTGSRIVTTRSVVRVLIQKGREKILAECYCAINLGRESKDEEIIFGSSFFEKVKITFDYPRNKFELKQGTTTLDKEVGR